MVDGEHAIRTRTDRFMAAGIFLLALVIRLAHFFEIREHDPFFELPSVDPRIYHEWALRILGGDIVGTGPFILGPLYPYFLAAVYKVMGPSIASIKLLQCLIGSALCVLVYQLGERLFSRAVALVAGIGAACYTMLVFYGGTLMIVNLLAPLTLLLVIAAYRAAESPAAAPWCVAGALLGLCALARENSLLIAPPLLAWMMLRAPVKTLRRRVTLGAFFCLAASLVILPATLRNLVVTGEPILVNAAGGISFYTGNNPDADGTFHVPTIFERTLADDPVQQYEMYSALADRVSNRHLGPSELTRFWVGEGFRFIREKPASWAALELRKLDLFFNAAEIWNNRPVSLARGFSAVLRFPLLTFGVALPLAFIGFIVTLGRWRSLAPLYIIVGVHLLSALLLIVLSRYRMPAVPVVLLFAANGAVWIVRTVRRRRPAGIATVLALLVLLFLAVNREVVEEDLSVAKYNLANRYSELGCWDEAIRAYRSAIEENPDYISSFNNLAVAYERSGRTADAIATWRDVLRIAGIRGMGAYVDRAKSRIAMLEQAVTPVPVGPQRR